MTFRHTYLHITVTAFLVMVGNSLPVQAQEAVSGLLESLAEASEDEALRLDRQIKAEWAKSGSASMNLLLRRGNKALEEDDAEAAIDHFRALTDHAPEFAEGWHGLARAYFASQKLGPALDALGKTLEMNPTHYDALYGLGVMFQSFNDYQRAEDAYRQVLDLHPHHENAKQALDSLKREGIGRTL